MAEPRGGGVKTLAIQLSDEQHAQLALIAQVEKVTLKDVLRQAVEALIAAKRAEGDFAERAAATLAEIDREAAARREAIQSLFGEAPPTPEGDESTRSRGRRSDQSS